METPAEQNSGPPICQKFCSTLHLLRIQVGQLGSWLLIHTDFSVVVKFSGSWWYKCVNLHCSPDPLKPMHLAQ